MTNGTQNLEPHKSGHVTIEQCYMQPFLFFNADCMEIMDQYPDKHFDLAIVDPPYGIGFSDYERGGSGIKTQKRHTKNGKKRWDDCTPDEEYFKELKRVSKDQIVFGGNYFIELAKVESPNLKTIEQFNEYIKNSSENWLFWYKQNPVPNFADGELAWWSFENNAQFDYRYYGNLEGNSSTTEKIHPTQKPIALYSWLVINYAQNGFKIIDTHLGSGSIALAVDKANKLDNMNLEFVGVELDSEYYNAALNRFRLAHAQSCLSF